MYKQRLDHAMVCKNFTHPQLQKRLQLTTDSDIIKALFAYIKLQHATSLIIKLGYTD